MTIEKFTILVPDSLLADLGRRLDATRWPDELENVGWELGSSLSYMKSLADYWRNGYEWRQQEATLNQLPQYRVSLDGFHVHFVHVRSKNPKSLPLIITHGWPGSFVEMVKIIPLLTDPAAHGGSAEDAFDVIVPSLPGYGFSDRPTERGMNPFKVAALWARLMAELGYERFAAQGGDWGSTISTALGLDHAQRVIGIHLNYIAGRFLFGGTLDQSPEDEIAKSYLAELRAWADLEGGYSHLQGTKPQTLGYALNDSPVGLAAWIVEKFRTWSDCGGDLERSFSKDQLLTNITLYWVTQTAASSARLYYEMRRAGVAAVPQARVQVPTGVANYPAEITRTPREWAERRY